MQQESCYGRVHSAFVAFMAWFTDVLVPFIPMTVFSRLIQFSADSTFRLVQWWSRLQGRPLPPGFNKNFEGRLAGVKPAQVKWLAECPERGQSDPVILYLHGGGYGWALQTSQVAALRDIYFGVGNPRLSILVLNYTTSVYAGYPTQLRETAEVYNALAASTKNIVLFGDSAGGHLSLQLMRHIAAPVESVPRVTQRPAAFVGISPAVDMSVDPGVTGHRNTQHDIVSVHMIRGWGQMLARDESLVQSPTVRLQLDRDVDWHAVLPPPSKILIAYGGREVLIDSIETFITNNNLKERGCTIYAHPMDFHDSLMILGSPSPMLKPVVEFLKNL